MVFALRNDRPRLYHFARITQATRRQLEEDPREDEWGFRRDVRKIKLRHVKATLGRVPAEVRHQYKSRLLAKEGVSAEVKDYIQTL